MYSISNKYPAIYDARPKPVFKVLEGDRRGKQIGYFSDFLYFLKNTFNVDLVFHGKEGKEPYGYTIIDSPGRNIFKGGEVMPLKHLSDHLRPSERQSLTMSTILARVDGEAFEKLNGTAKAVFTYERKEHYRNLSTILSSIIYDFSRIKEGEAFHGVKILSVDNRLYANNKDKNLFLRYMDLHPRLLIC